MLLQYAGAVTAQAGGQKPWLVAIQQGGQLKDSFGGIVPAARALLGALSPMVIWLRRLLGPIARLLIMLGNLVTPGRG